MRALIFNRPFSCTKDSPAFIANKILHYIQQITIPSVAYLSANQYCDKGEDPDCSYNLF
jgi:hypothetical protein